MSTTAALGCTLSALAHPGAALALLATQRSAAAGALRRLTELRQLGTPGAATLAMSLGASTRDAFLCDAVLSSHIPLRTSPAPSR